MVELGCFCGIDWFLVVVGCFSSFNELVKTEQISWPFISFCIIIIDAVGSSQIFFPTQNLARAY